MAHTEIIPTEFRGTLAPLRTHLESLRMHPDLSFNKYHHLFGHDLKVALETRADNESTYLSDSSIPSHLLHRCRNGDLKFYYPALADADHSRLVSECGSIRFIPWFIAHTAKHHSLVFTSRPRQSDNGPFRWIRFARYGEKRTWTFKYNQNKPAHSLPGLNNSYEQHQLPYMPLDFFSKRRNEFIPLFIKIATEEPREPFTYLSIRAENKKTTLMVDRIREEEAPKHLQKDQP